MFCPECGKKLEETDKVCPQCGEQIVAEQPVAPVKKPKTVIKFSPVTMLGLVFSGLAFLFGFIITTTALANKGLGIAYVEFLGILPAFVGLGIGVYQTFDEKSDKNTKLFALIDMAASGFAPKEYSVVPPHD